MSESLDDAPGEVFSETEHATTYKGATAISFEGKNRYFSEMFLVECTNRGAVR